VRLAAFQFLGRAEPHLGGGAPLAAAGQWLHVCRLRHVELLDAAHILPDSHPRGEPVVPNGLALCKLHHAAFDTNIMGVRPDLVIEVRPEVLRETDGPMLRHGLQEVDGASLHAPRRSDWRPGEEYLQERYEQFREAG
jgi:putative restriction endonuclease